MIIYVLCFFHTIAILTHLERAAASFRLQKRSDDRSDDVLPSLRESYENEQTQHADFRAKFSIFSVEESVISIKRRRGNSGIHVRKKVVDIKLHV